ncbi:MAG: ribose-phosphate pyrophosphokinase, partial [Bdellovibrionales bacterium]|nr:ribose-phosphate pyrophosphokinase [Bdellovibrionales bacterium]
ILVDDMVDTGTTMIKAADALLDRGAVKVVTICTHPVLSGKAKERLPQSGIEKLIVSDTIYHQDLPDGEDSWVVQLSVASIIGEAMKRIHMDQSISSLFEMN